MKVINLLNTGRCIKETVKRKGFTVHYCASRLEMSDQAFYHYQTGQSLPSLTNLVNLADILGVRIGDLLKYDEIEDF